MAKYIYLENSVIFDINKLQNSILFFKIAPNLWLMYYQIMFMGGYVHTQANSQVTELQNHRMA